MKVNKITLIACLIIAVLSGILLVIFNENSLMQSVFSGIFTGFIVSFVVATIGYFHEHSKIIESAKNGINGLYLNLSVMSKILGNALPQIQNFLMVQEQPYNYLTGLSNFNCKYMDEMNLSLYSSFFPNSRYVIVFKDMTQFGDVINSIKYNSSNLYITVLEYNHQCLMLNNKQLERATISDAEKKELDRRKNLVTVSAAKLHEYLACQVNAMERMANKFYKHKKKQLNWDEIKPILDSKAENIVKGNTECL